MAENRRRPSNGPPEDKGYLGAVESVLPGLAACDFLHDVWLPEARRALSDPQEGRDG